MNNKIYENPKFIYDFFNQKIFELFDKNNNLKQNNLNIDNTNLKHKEIHQILYNLKEKISNYMKQLETNSEWSTFQMAFFGETNAGKSTIIETLRILLNEPSKVDEQNIFKYAQNCFARTKTKLKLKPLKFNKIKNYFDGQIIGDGRSDFTRESTIYQFEINNYPVSMIDVPGIEGNEKIIKDEITKAIQKTHVVFYVTSKDAPPNEGTLERIQSYLNDQTEVWAIYNKQITNPRQLNKALIHNDDERLSLNDLEIKLKETLGSHYCGLITLAGLPAFFSQATCINPFSIMYDQQKKFLDKFGRDGLYQLSQLQSLENKLKQHIIGDIPTKIKRSNFNKVKVLINDCCVELIKIHETYEHYEQDLNKKIALANQSIRDYFNDFEMAVKGQSESIIGEFQRKCRNEIYNYIDKDVSNDDFKSKFNRVLENQSHTLELQLKEMIERHLKELEKNIAKTQKEMIRQVNTLGNEYKQYLKFNNSTIPLDFKIDSGINTMGLASTLIGGAVFSAWNLVGGWVVAISAGLVISFVKAIWGFFSSDYKKEQQRKNVDSNLSKITKENRIKIEDNLCNLFNYLSNLQKKITQDLHAISLPIKQINQDLNTSIKSYVSEAHIILYVINSKNPIKESHKDNLIWLFKELNLLPRTVFVLSRFDEVADVEDEKEYQHYLKIKQDNVRSRLNEFLQLTQQELNELKIVGVSANPFDEGLEYWLQNPKEFEQLSHIGTLQKATKEIVENSGSLNNIIDETRKSVFRDIIFQELPKIEEKNRELSKISQDLQYLYELQSGELEQLAKRINFARGNIKTQLNGYFSDLLMQANGIGIETAQDFLDTAVGKDGVLISSSINQIFMNETAGITSSLNHQIIKFDTNLNNIDSFASQVMKQGLNHLVKNVKLDNKTILAARDGINSVAKMAGFDISKMLKFKPYGATQLANKLNGTFAVLGLIMEAADSYQKYQVEKEFKQAISDFRTDIQTQQQEILQMIDSNEFIPTFFQGYLDLKNAVDNLKNQKKNEQNRQTAFREWKRQGEIIEGEFKKIL